MSYMGPIVLQVVLIGLNAIFASAEIAVISMNDTKLQKMAKEGDARAKRLVSLTEQPTKFLSTIQVAITLAGLLGSAFAAENFAGALVTAIQGTGVGISAAVLETFAVFVITLIYIVLRFYQSMLNTFFKYTTIKFSRCNIKPLRVMINFRIYYFQ